MGKVPNPAPTKGNSWRIRLAADQSPRPARDPVAGQEADHSRSKHQHDLKGNSHAKAREEEKHQAKSNAT